MASRKQRTKANAKWAELAVLLNEYFGERFWMQHCSEASARRAAIASIDHVSRKLIAAEWWKWNNSNGTEHDIRSELSKLGVDIPFDTAAEARNFMNAFYDELIVAIRATAPGWKP